MAGHTFKMQHTFKMHSCDPLGPQQIDINKCQFQWATGFTDDERFICYDDKRPEIGVLGTRPITKTR